MSTKLSCVFLKMNFIFSPLSSNQMSNSDNNEALPDYIPPNISDAARFRLSTLPRRLRDPTQPSGFRLAAMGEDKDQFGNPALHYPLFFSGKDILNEFGVGVSLYFKTLKALFVLLFICAFISLVKLSFLFFLELLFFLYSYSS